MYKAYLSYSQVKEYLAFLEEQELMSHNKGEQVYIITPKGYEFLHKYDEMSELISQGNEKNLTAMI